MLRLMQDSPKQHHANNRNDDQHDQGRDAAGETEGGAEDDVADYPARRLGAVAEFAPPDAGDAHARADANYTDD